MIRDAILSGTRLDHQVNAHSAGRIRCMACIVLAILRIVPLFKTDNEFAHSRIKTIRLCFLHIRRLCHKTWLIYNWNKSAKCRKKEEGKNEERESENPAKTQKPVLFGTMGHWTHVIAIYWFAVERICLLFIGEWKKLLIIR